MLRAEVQHHRIDPMRAADYMASVHFNLDGQVDVQMYMAGYMQNTCTSAACAALPVP